MIVALVSIMIIFIAAVARCVYVLVVNEKCYKIASDDFVNAYWYLRIDPFELLIDIRTWNMWTAEATAKYYGRD